VLNASVVVAPEDEMEPAKPYARQNLAPAEPQPHLSTSPPSYSFARPRKHYLDGLTTLEKAWAEDRIHRFHSMMADGQSFKAKQAERVQALSAIEQVLTMSRP
jgi:hypothetical protein